MNINEDIKREAGNYIKNNCKYYKNYFCTRDYNIVMKNVVKIVEEKLLDVNSFCYYLNETFSLMFFDFKFYRELSKKNQKNLDCYQRSVIKISMYLNSIFSEINDIKSYLENNNDI